MLYKKMYHSKDKVTFYFTFILTTTFNVRLHFSDLEVLKKASFQRNLIEARQCRVAFCS